MTTKSNQSISKRVLMFCGSALVTSTAVLSFSSEAPAKDRPATIHNHSQAQAICPNLCRQFSNVERYPESGWYPHKWTGHWTHVPPGAPAAVCGCGEWRYTKKGAKFRQLTPAEQRTFDVWQNLIANRGFNPGHAAGEAGASDYKKLYSTTRNGKKVDMYQMRLSRKNRVTFIVDEDNFMVEVDQVGGHTR